MFFKKKKEKLEANLKTPKKNGFSFKLFRKSLNSKQKNVKERNFASSLASLKNFRKTKVTVGGSLVFSTMNKDIDPGDAYELLAPRKIFYFPTRKLERLYLWVHKDIFSIANENELSIGIAQDYYLKYGCLSFKKIILFGGGATNFDFNLEAYTFESGRLISVSEYVLSGRHSPDFFLILQEHLDSICVLGYEYVWCPPLPMDQKIFEILKEKKITQLPSFVSKLPLPNLAITKKSDIKSCIGFGVGATLLLLLAIMPAWLGWREYQSSVKMWHVTAANFFSQYEDGLIQLDDLEKKRFYLDKKGNNEELDMRKILSAFSSINAVNILNFEFDIISKKYKVNISVPVRSSYVFSQAKNVMDYVISHVGGKMHLISHFMKNVKHGFIAEDRYFFVFEGEL